MKKLFILLLISTLCGAQSSITGKAKITGKAQIQIITAPSGFSISISPTVIPVLQGSTNTATVTVSSSGSFNSAVTLSVGTLPSGVTAGFSPNPITPSPGGTATSTLTLTASGVAPIVTCTPFVLTGTSGATSHSTSPCVTVSSSTSTFYSQLPTLWVYDGIAVNQVPDVVITLDGITSNNFGPNCHNGTGPTAAPICGNGGSLPYTDDIPGLNDAVKNWRDNAAQGSVGGFTYSDKGWLIQIPPQSYGPVLVGHTFDNTNNALVSMPGKFIDPTAPTVATMPTKYLVINSLVPNNPANGMVCGRGLPGITGARNAGCVSPNDKANMWHIQADAAPTNIDDIAMSTDPDYVGKNQPGFPVAYANHILVMNMEADVHPGLSQSGQGVYKCPWNTALSCGRPPKPIQVDNGKASFPPNPLPAYIGVMYSYIHGWDPGDPGQPTTLGGAIEDAAGTCSNFAVGQPPVASPQWGTATTISVANTDGSHGTLTRVSGQYFGPTIPIGTVVTVGPSGSSAQYTVTAVDYVNQVLTVSGQPGTDYTGVQNFSATDVSNNITSVPSQYTPGCGDDFTGQVSFNCDYCWFEHNYAEKTHWTNSESHALGGGFSHGPTKEVDNYLEGGSGTWFSGGAPADVQGGPTQNLELRQDYIGRDLNYRFLTGGSGQSPAPPFGCGTLIKQNPKASSCPFNWAVKNSIEFKMGRFNLVDGNIVENSWADAQSGWPVLFNVRTCSGGSVCGVFDPITGLPLNATDNIRFSNNWIRNAPQTIQFANRSTSQPGDGGGVSAPIKNVDMINNLFSNVGDNQQFGTPGNELLLTAGQNTFACVMSVNSGVGATAIGHGNCQPFQYDITFKTKSISRTGGVVTIDFNPLREDPYLCLAPLTPSQCIAMGRSATIIGVPGWNGTFAMLTTNGTSFSGSYGTNGTGGSAFTYADNQGPDGVLCSGSTTPTCIKFPGLALTMASLASKIHDISPGDDVYAKNASFSIASASESGTTGTFLTATPQQMLPGDPITISGIPGYNGDYFVATSSPTSFTINGMTPGLSPTTGGTATDTSCSNNNFAVGATSATLACDGVSCSPMNNPVSMDVYYPAPNASGTALCSINNGSGFPKNVTYQNNTSLAPDNFALTAFNPPWQSLNNQFFNNIFVTNDATLHGSGDFICNSQSGEGNGTGYPSGPVGSPKSSFACLDLNTLGFYNNVLNSRDSRNWSVINCPGGTCTNSFPQNVNCPTSTADGTCIGFTGFMTSTPTIQFPGQGMVTTSGTAVTWSSGAKFLADGSMNVPTFTIVSASETANTGTYTLLYPSNPAISKNDKIVVAGMSVSGYNGSFTVATVGVPNPNNFTVNGLAGSLSAATGGTVQDTSNADNIIINGVQYNIATISDTTHLTLIATAGVQASPVPYHVSGSCAAAGAPFNCPLMSLPWANNLTLANLHFVASSLFKNGYGADTNAISTAMTAPIYTCPALATCGTPSTVTQVAATATTATYTAANTYFAGEYLTSISGCSHSQFNQSGVVVASANSTSFTVNGTYTTQATVSDSCTALNGPAPQVSSTLLPNIDDITTQAGGGGSTPPGWFACGSGCGGTTITPVITQTFANASPAIDGASMQMSWTAADTTGQLKPGSNWLDTYKIIGGSGQNTFISGLTHFVSTSNFYPDTNAKTYVNQYEIDAGFFSPLSIGANTPNGTNYMFGAQCNTTSGIIQIWTGKGGTPGGDWVNATYSGGNIPCTVKANTWNSLIVYGHIVTGDQTSCTNSGHTLPFDHYDLIVWNGNAYIPNNTNTCAQQLDPTFHSLVFQQVQANVGPAGSSGNTMNIYYDENSMVYW